MVNDGQVIASDYPGFSAPQLVATEPQALNVDILGYDGREFSITNSFDMDRHTYTKGLEVIKFRYQIICESGGFTALWEVRVDNENDEAPMLVEGVIHSNFYVDVSESSPPGTIIPFALINKIDDPDPGDVITYSMRAYSGSMQDSYPFTMIDNVGLGHIQVNGTLDYESDQLKYVYQIFADDLVGHRLAVILVITIKDGNDFPPKFDSSSYSLVIAENVPPGSTFYTTPPIAAQDQDRGIGERLRYSLISGHSILGREYFSIDEWTGEIIVESELDRERVSSYTILLKAEEVYSPEKYASALLIVNVTDVNDSPPQFDQPEYSTILEEHSPEYTVIAELSVSDGDLNSYLTFLLGDHGGIFAIEKTGINKAELYVYNSDLLDRESFSSLTLRVLVSDRVTQSSALVYVSLTDINDNLPIFTRAVYSFAPVNETASVGYLLGQVAATDADTGVNGQVTYHMLVGDVELFEVDITSGKVKLVGDLSVNYLPSYELRVVATDSGSPPLFSMANVRITVIDLNTQRPVFLSTYYEVRVLEDAAIGSTVVKVEATDEDSGAEIVYLMSARRFLSNSPENWFRVINSTGEVLLTAAPDRESEDSYRFEVTAFDGYHYSIPSAIVEIIVVDVNDNSPTFDSNYIFSISEGCSNRYLGQVHASDLDIGSNAAITYHVYSNDYLIQSETGLLNISRCVDRETESMLSLVVYAVDGGSAILTSGQLTGTTLVSILITDVNDNKPVFSQPHYTLNYREGFNGFIDFPPVLDADLSPNTEYRISMISGSADFFRLTTEGVSLLQPLSVPPAFLSYDYTIVLKVENTEMYVGPPAADNTATIRIQVTSVNTHDPQFTKLVYTVAILENLEIGSNVLTLRASDGDGDLITYAFASSTSQLILDTFEMHGESGVVSLTQGVDAEDEALSGPYLFEVVARDPYERYSLARVNITVVDVNDNAPQINIDKFEVDISESQTAGYTLPIILSVTDEDSGDNGVVQCSVAPPLYLSIEGCRTVTLIRQVDYEEVKLIDMVISAADGGQPFLLSSAWLTINILPENDNSPVFEKESYTFNVSENIMSQFTVGTVRAMDSDLDELTYSLQPPDIRETFSISSLGLLYVTRPLDRESREEYIIQVSASDGELTIAVWTYIRVLDQNDNPPVFILDESAYYVRENQQDDHVLQVRAVDDLDVGVNAEVIYEILSGNLDAIFSINISTGIVGISKPELIDFERNSEFQLTIQAKDLG
ncbi:protocadherin Fat 4-like [Watersipora subatra]|uniref:protocadherin Fat 4-like n=1 Tax=Watersipora subatra TaxID=2589382 RepID=UPI00355C8D4E